MDWVAFWTAVAAVAAWVAAIGALGALLAITLQLQLDRESREVDYYRKLTPFLSFETKSRGSAVPDSAAGNVHRILVYADGGGYAFNVFAHIDHTTHTSGGARLVGQNVIRYLRAEKGDDSHASFITFGRQAVEGFQ